MVYHYIMYGELPTNEFFTCAPAHVKEMRLFMIYEIARLASLPPKWSVSEIALYNATADQRTANKALRKQRAQAQREFALRNGDNVILNYGLLELDAEFVERLIAQGVELGVVIEGVVHL